MKIKSILLGIVLMFTFLGPVAQAFASDGKSLPVKMEFRDDGAHAFMPRWEPTVRKILTVQQNPPPEPFLLTGHYSFARKEWSAVAANSFDVLWKDLGGRKGMNVELFGLLGGSGEAAIAGGGLGLIVPLHERISLTGGLALTKRGSTFESFFTELKGIELGGWIGIAYTLPFRS